MSRPSLEVPGRFILSMPTARDQRNSKERRTNFFWSSITTSELMSSMLGWHVSNERLKYCNMTVWIVHVYSNCNISSNKQVPLVTLEAAAHTCTL